MARKIAIIGKAPSSRLLAPYDDVSWDIWSLSDNFTILPRWTAWFELHDLDRYRGLYPDYYDWMCALPANPERPLYVKELRPEMPGAVLFPKDEIVKRFGAYFTNSISWMICLAIEQLIPTRDNQTLIVEPGAIGLWGVDMAQNTEYAHQRPSCEYYMGWAKGLGIDLVVPDECDLCKTARLYGFEGQTGPLDIKIRARQRELTDRKTKCEHDLSQADKAVFSLAGALQELAAHPNGDPQQKARLEQMKKDLDLANMQRTQLGRFRDKLDGALEDLSWIKQHA